MEANETAARNLLIDILLDDKKQGWARDTDIERMREFCSPGASNDEVAKASRRVSREAWAYRDELETKPSDELRTLAAAVTHRQEVERREAEQRRQLEAKKAMFISWARKPYWTQDEAAHLVLGHDPATVRNERYGLTSTDSFEELEDLLSRAIRHGHLKRESAPKAILHFLRGKKFGVAAELLEAVNSLEPPKPKVAVQEVLAPKPFQPLSEPQTITQECKMPSILGYDAPSELNVLFEAIQKFWVDADPNRPPKRDEIVSWIRERVDSDAKANSIDSLIRPAWARQGGNKKQSKG